MPDIEDIWDDDEDMRQHGGGGDALKSMAGKPMHDMTDDQLAHLGWKWVARSAAGKAVAVRAGGFSDDKEQIMEWLGEGYTVAQLFP